MSIMGYRSRLLPSIITLVLFYSSVGIVAFYSMGPLTLEQWLAERGLWDRAEDGSVTALNAASVATAVILSRLHEVWPWALAGTTAAVAIAWGVAGVFRLLRYRRARGGQEYRGISVTVSAMPSPPPPETVEVVVGGLSAFSKKVGLTKKHNDLLKAILGYLKVNEDAYCGSGHEKGVFDHTLGVMEKALEVKGSDPLLLLAAAAHDMGKITSYRQTDDGQWVRIKYHDKEGARVLARMDEWWQLPMPDRAILLLTVKHSHTPDRLPISAPDLKPEDFKRIALLIEQLRKIDGNTTGEEKEVSRQDRDIGEVVIEAFLQSILNAPFQRKGLAKGVQAVGWRDGSRLYVLERAMREFAMSQMDALNAALLSVGYRKRGEAADFTTALLDALEQRGWLVTTADIGIPESDERKSFTLQDYKTLWRVQSGTHVFNGVYIVELPAEHQHSYPEQTLYQITVLGTLHSESKLPKAAPKRERVARPNAVTNHKRPVPNLRRTPEPAEPPAAAVEDAATAEDKEADPLEDSGSVSFFAE